MLDEIICVSNFFNKAECNEILENIKNVDFKESIVPKIRNNSRIFIYDNILIDKLLQKICNLVELNGIEITGIDNEIIIYKYRVGEFFKERYSNNNCLLGYIFLNEDYEGGDINFLKHEKLIIKKRLRDNISKKIIEKEQGKLIVFNDILPHEDLEVLSGNKYIISFEIIYIN